MEKFIWNRNSNFGRLMSITHRIASPCNQIDYRFCERHIDLTFQMIWFGWEMPISISIDDYFIHIHNQFASYRSSELCVAIWYSVMFGFMQFSHFTHKISNKGLCVISYTIFQTIWRYFWYKLDWACVCSNCHFTPLCHENNSGNNSIEISNI